MKWNCDICKRVIDRGHKHRLQYIKPYSPKLIAKKYNLCLPCYRKIERYIEELQYIFKDI